MAASVRLIRKRYDADALACPKKRKDPMRADALIEDPMVIRRILEHLELWAPEAMQRSAPLDFASWPRIPVPRCTTCNECTQINDKIFAYDANKQAHIANLEAGTYRRLVEAAESCQVSIIHPGKPRNPNEPGL